MPGGHNFSRSETLLGLKRCDGRAACYFLLKAAVLFYFLFFFFKKKKKGFSQRVPTVWGLVWSEKKGVSILWKLRPFSFLCFTTAAGLRGCGARGPGSHPQWNRLFFSFFFFGSVENGINGSAFDNRGFLWSLYSSVRRIFPSAASGIFGRGLCCTCVL